MKRVVQRWRTEVRQRSFYAFWVLAWSVGFTFAAEPAWTSQSIKETPLRVPAQGKIGFTLLRPDQTGIHFTNHLDEWASAENRVLNAGSGVAAGDFDNDGRVDLFFASLNNQNQLFRNLGNWRFADVTSSTGLTFAPGFYRAAVFADLNGDGWLDLLVGTVGRGVLCFLNDGRGRFVDTTAQAGTSSPYGTESLALADIDGNGTLDLYVANNRTDDVRDWPRVPVILVNKRPTIPPSLRDRLAFEGGQILESGEPHILYANDGQARFKPVGWTGGHFLDEQGRQLTNAPLDWGLTGAFRDLDGDGAPDLYVCNDYWTPDRIWLNNGNGRFRAIETLAIRKIPLSSMGVDFADINHDGHLDIFAVDMLSRSAELRKRQIIAKRPIAPRVGDVAKRVQTPQNTLLLNRGDGTYAEIACFAGLQASDWSWSSMFLDVDLDGHDDLLITAGHLRDIQDLDANEKIRSLGEGWRRNASGDLQRAFTEAKREHTKLYPLLQMPVVAFRNLGNVRFEEVTKNWGLDAPAVHHGIALADFDGDGDLDAAINCLDSPAAIYQNESVAPRIAVRLHGRAPNTQAIGARIELIGGPVPHQKTEVVSGGSYLSGSDPVRVFATGDRTNNISLEVTWRSGSVTRIASVNPNHLYEVREPDQSPSIQNQKFKIKNKIPPLFKDVSQWLAHTHHDEPFNDFQRQPLLPRKLSQSGPGVTWFDLNADGWDDLIIASGKGGQTAIFTNKFGKAFGPFRAPDLNVAVAHDQTTILAFRQRSESVLLAGNASYEEITTNIPVVLPFSFSSTLKNSQLTNAAFPAHSSSIGPIAAADIEGDGDLDLFVGGQVIPGRYPEPASSLVPRWENGQWRLDATNNSTLREIGLVSGAAWSNLDDDPLPELILACEWGPIRIFRNQSGKLVPWDPPVRSDDSRSSTLNQLTGLWTGVTAGDFDEDGRLDIVAGNWGLNACAPVSSKEPLTLVYGDFAGLGRVDIIETEYDSGKLVPRLQRDALAAALPFVSERFRAHSAYSRGTVADLLGDKMRQAKRLSVTTLATTVFLNRGGRFEARQLPDEVQFAPTWSVQVADLDGDGHEDIFLSQNFFAFAREESRLDAGRGLCLLGNGRGDFKTLQLSGIEAYGEQRGAALADFDRDGRVDIALTQNGAATKLYRNVGAQPGLRVHLQGKGDNTDAIGAIVRLRCGDRWGPARPIQCGSGYWSQNSMVPVLGRAESPSHLWVRWPTGQTSETPVPADAIELTIAEP